MRWNDHKMTKAIVRERDDEQINRSEVISDSRMAGGLQTGMLEGIQGLFRMFRTRRGYIMALYRCVKVSKAECLGRSRFIDETIGMNTYTGLSQRVDP